VTVLERSFVVPYVYVESISILLLLQLRISLKLEKPVIEAIAPQAGVVVTVGRNNTTFGEAKPYYYFSSVLVYEGIVTLVIVHVRVTAMLWVKLVPSTSSSLIVITTGALVVGVADGVRACAWMHPLVE